MNILKKGLIITSSLLLIAITIWISVFNQENYHFVAVGFYGITIILRNKILHLFDRNDLSLFYVTDLFVVAYGISLVIATMIADNISGSVEFYTCLVLFFIEILYSNNERPMKFYFPNL